APMAEECFFRGMLQTMLLRVLRRRWVAVLAPALLFGMAHLDQPHVVPALTLFGVILGLQYERSGALVGPIALHALFNLKTLIWEWLVSGAGG
ncbi:MAG: CPBP family intramembrane glutamic endopeptidase, partial [Planctomycetota bacterium]